MTPRKHTVRLLRVAEDDLSEIIGFIAADNRGAAEKMLVNIERLLMSLSAHPYLGKIPKEEELAQWGYRYLTMANYLIFYTVSNTTVLIHRIIHGARDYSRLL